MIATFIVKTATGPGAIRGYFYAFTGWIFPRTPNSKKIPGIFQAPGGRGRTGRGGLKETMDKYDRARANGVLK